MEIQSLIRNDWDSCLKELLDGGGHISSDNQPSWVSNFWILQVTDLIKCKETDKEGTTSFFCGKHTNFYSLAD